MINLNLLEDQPVRLLHGISKARLVAVSTHPTHHTRSFQLFFFLVKQAVWFSLKL